MYTNQDLKDMSGEELQKEIQSAQKELADLRIRVNLGQENKIHLLKNQKTYIARIKTFLTEKIKFQAVTS